MSFNISDKLKILRKNKGVSQEKLAQYLNVSFQAVSKWENDNAYPDISLLPEIARFFGVTVDELLQVEKLDEERLYEEYRKKAEALYRDGKCNETLAIWHTAYKEMPNNIQVKEMLMSAYYDTDKVKYKNEIIELGMEIYNSDAPMYYKGQAIREIANTYAANNNAELADKWAMKSLPVFHSREILFTEIFDGNEMLFHVSFCTYWFLNSLFYMAIRIDNSDTIAMNLRSKQDMFKAVSQLYEVIYKNDDMSFESLRLLYVMHFRLAELEISLENDESRVKYHMERALNCVLKSMSINEHDLELPMLYGWHIEASPSDNKQYVRMMQQDIKSSSFDSYRSARWFKTIENELSAVK